ncbi:MAG: ACT domain-containing protein [Gammaproteobacteria bacterium]|nr:ACT domain-containing protein [Gammaproteobacteria bacterium]MBT6480473.1 ACT domain-containing protein [Gammaproteobacteria bacterium]MBT7227635.1 ACT domain-containing protein [Gammaproteobacteria bacterium]
MAGEEDLDNLLALLNPSLLAGDFVFCTVENAQYGDFADLQPIASYQEEEGLSLLLARGAAESAGLAYESVFSCISLMVHSSLDAVGLTAAVSGRLAAHGISANMIAAYYHDHIYVPQNKAQLALQVLAEL